MSFNNKQEYYSLEFEYELVTEGKTRIFSSSFIEQNRDKCKMIHNNKEHNLIEYYEDINNDYRYYDSVKIQIIFNNNITDIGKMCYDCKTLLSVRDVSDLDDSFIFNKIEPISRLNSKNSIKSKKSQSFYDDNSSLSSISLTPFNSNTTLNNEI